jgi:hypothetical protein
LFYREFRFSGLPDMLLNDNILPAIAFLSHESA